MEIGYVFLMVSELAQVVTLTGFVW